MSERSGAMATKLRGVALLRDPHLNKSTAFTRPNARRWDW